MLKRLTCYRVIKAHDREDTATGNLSVGFSGDSYGMLRHAPYLASGVDLWSTEYVAGAFACGEPDLITCKWPTSIAATPADLAGWIVVIPDGPCVLSNLSTGFAPVDSTSNSGLQTDAPSRLNTRRPADPETCFSRPDSFDCPGFSKFGGLSCQINYEVTL